MRTYKDSEGFQRIEIGQGKTIKFFLSSKRYNDPKVIIMDLSNEQLEDFIKGENMPNNGDEQERRDNWSDIYKYVEPVVFPLFKYSKELWGSHMYVASRTYEILT